MRPFLSTSPWWALGVVSLVTGFLMVLIFRYTSNQQGIRDTKNVIKAHVLELWLFRDDPRIMLSAQGQLLRLQVRYLRLAAIPMLALMVPVGLLLLSLDGWFGYRPLHAGETAIVSVQLRAGEPGLLERASMEAEAGVTIETPPLRIMQAQEVDWRIRAITSGAHTLWVNLDRHKVEKTVMVSDQLVHVAPQRIQGAFWKTFLHPGERPIPEDSPVQQIEVHYPARAMTIFGWDMHWIVVFFILSIFCGFALKGLLRVEL